MNYQKINDRYISVTQRFFYDIFDRLSSDFFAENTYVVFVARRCFVLSRWYLEEYIKTRNLSEETVERIKSHIYTDSAFRVLVLELAEKYSKQQFDFTVLLCDDILIFGRAIGGLLANTESLFVRKYMECSNLSDNDYNKEEQIGKEFLRRVRIKTIFKNDQGSLLHSRFVPCLEKIEDDYNLPPSVWRKISYYFANQILDTNIPNATFMSYIRDESGTVTKNLKAVNRGSGFRLIQNNYHGRSLSSFIRAFNHDGSIISLYTIRIFGESIVPFVFLPKTSGKKLTTVYERIFSMLISAEEVETKKEAYAKLRDALKKYDENEETSVVSIQFVDMFFSLNLLRLFLNLFNLADAEKEKIVHELNYDILEFNFCHNNTVMDVAKRTIDLSKEPLLTMQQMDEMIAETAEIHSIVKNYTETNIDSLNPEILENIAFDYAVESETLAHQLERGSLEPSDSAVVSILYSEKITVENSFKRIYRELGNKKADIETVTAYILQLMDAGVFAVSASRKGSDCLFYLRSSEQALTTVPGRYAKFLPLLYEIELHCPTNSRFLQSYYLKELDLFFDKEYTKNLDLEYKSFLLELCENKTGIVEMVNKILSSFQSFRDYLFMISYNLDTRYEELAAKAKSIYRAVMF